jgi:hypothetical protein
VAVWVVIPAFAARAHARSSASFPPKKGDGSRLLHSLEYAATKIFVPGLTVHVMSSPLGENGATVPPRSMQGLPPVNGF